MTTGTFDRGFACYEVILHGHDLEIGLATGPIVAANASIEEMVRIMSTRRVRLI